MVAAGLIKQLHPRSEPNREWQMFVAGVRHQFDQLLWSPRSLNPEFRKRFLEICSQVQSVAQSSTRRGIQS